jgi:hypothetical protein
MARKAGNGRLSRVGFTEPRRNLARPRDVYELPESPEKRPFHLPERVNWELLKVVRKKKARDVGLSDGDGLPPEAEDVVGVEGVADGQATDESSSRRGDEQANVDGSDDAVEDLIVPSSPPRIVPESGADHSAEETNVQVEAHQKNGAARCAVISYRSDKPAGPRYEQCHNAGKNSTDEGPRCFRHVKKGGSRRCEYESDDEGIAVQCRTVGVNGTDRCSKHTGIDEQPESSPSRTQKQKRGASDVPTQKNSTARISSKRRSEESQVADSRPSKSTKTKMHAVPGRRTEEHEESTNAERDPARQSLTKSDPQVEIPVRRSKKQASAKQNATVEEHDEEVADSIEVAVLASRKSGKRNSSKARPGDEEKRGTRSGKSEKPAKATGTSVRRRGSDNDSAREHEEQLEDAEDGEEAAREEETSADETSGNATHTPKSLKRAFRFLNLEKRAGRCQTDLCVCIKRVCDRTSSLFRDQDLPIEEILKNMANVQATMNQILEVEDDRAEAKEDMYGYVFRSLTKVLRTLYDDLVQRYDNIMDSIDAMRILHSFVRDILALKDALDGWKVTVPQRYKGDRVVQDVITHLVVPLRQVESTFSRRLALLENKDGREQQLAKMHLQADEDERELRKKDEAFVTTRKRWNRWQLLHITRMQCEPDPLRRRHLTIVKLEDIEERDANGDRFERLPVFTQRNAPSPHWASSIAKAKEWSGAQEEALLGGLEAFAGKSSPQTCARISADQI